MNDRNLAVLERMMTRRCWLVSGVGDHWCTSIPRLCLKRLPAVAGLHRGREPMILLAETMLTLEKTSSVPLHFCWFRLRERTADVAGPLASGDSGPWLPARPAGRRRIQGGIGGDCGRSHCISAVPDLRWKARVNDKEGGGDPNSGVALPLRPGSPDQPLPEIATRTVGARDCAERAFVGLRAARKSLFGHQR